MKNSQLNQVIKLVRRTGDRVVIMDNESEEVMVLLDMNNYEKLLSGNQMIEKMTEEELLEKINRDIAVWRAYNESEGEIFEDENIKVEKQSVAPKKIGNEQKWVEEELAETEFGKNEIIKQCVEDIGTIENEEPLDGVQEEEDEEKFYLEPIE